MTKRKLFTYRGRLNRIRYLLYSNLTNLFVITSFILMIVTPIWLLGLTPYSDSATSIVPVLLVLLVTFLLSIAYIFSLILQLFYASRRLHDMGAPGPLCLLLLLPFFNIIFWFVLIFYPGMAQTNQHGDVPTKNSTRAIVIAIVSCLLNVLFTVVFTAVTLTETIVHTLPKMH